MLEDQRIDFLKVAAAIGVIERDAVLQQFDAAQMIATAEARAPYRETHFLTVTLARENARREGERVLQVGRIFILELVGGHDADCAGHPGKLALLFLNARCRECAGLGVPIVETVERRWRGCGDDERREDRERDGGGK